MLLLEGKVSHLSLPEFSCWSGRSRLLLLPEGLRLTSLLSDTSCPLVIMGL
jgi:hypothetical protein